MEVQFQYATRSFYCTIVPYMHRLHFKVVHAWVEKSNIFRLCIALLHVRRKAVTCTQADLLSTQQQAAVKFSRNTSIHTQTCIGKFCCKLSAYLFRSRINSLSHSVAIWSHISRSSFNQVVACCLVAPSHDRDQFWLTISDILWHSS